MAGMRITRCRAGLCALLHFSCCRVGGGNPVTRVSDRYVICVGLIL